MTKTLSRDLTNTSTGEQMIASENSSFAVFGRMRDTANKKARSPVEAGLFRWKMVWR
jgi:hypothetical protein